MFQVLLPHSSPNGDGTPVEFKNLLTFHFRIKGAIIA